MTIVAIVAEIYDGFARRRRERLDDEKERHIRELEDRITKLEEQP